MVKLQQKNVYLYIKFQLFLILLIIILINILLHRNGYNLYDKYSYNKRISKEILNNNIYLIVRFLKFFICKLLLLIMHWNIKINLNQEIIK